MLGEEFLAIVSIFCTMLVLLSIQPIVVLGMYSGLPPQPTHRSYLLLCRGVWQGYGVVYIYMSIYNSTANCNSLVLTYTTKYIMQLWTI